MSRYLDIPFLAGILLVFRVQSIPLMGLLFTWDIPSYITRLQFHGPDITPLLLYIFSKTVTSIRPVSSSRKETKPSLLVGGRAALLQVLQLTNVQPASFETRCTDYVILTYLDALYIHWLYSRMRPSILIFRSISPALKSLLYAAGS